MITSIFLLMAVGLPPVEGGSPSSRDHNYNQQAPITLSNLIQAPGIEEDWVVRGQSPVEYGPALTVPLDGTSTYYQPGVPVQSYPADPFLGGQGYGVPSYPAPISSDPWLGGELAGAPVSPYAVPTSGFGFGTHTFSYNGPRRHRFGWQALYDFEYIPGSGTSNPDVGDFDTFGADFEKIWTTPLADNWIFTMAPQFNYRSFTGPTTPGATFNDIPGSAFRFGLGLKIQTPAVYGWSLELGFNPAIATDFGNSLTSDAVMFDGHAVLHWNWNPQLSWAFGVAYWDRVDDIVLPYAGVVWNPSPLIEFELLFPRPKVSIFLGNPFGIATWAYAVGEYHVEAYEVDIPMAGTSSRMQIEDWRVMGGLKWESGWFTSFVEAGVVLDRNVEFESPGGGFDQDTSFIGRFGFRY